MKHILNQIFVVLGVLFLIQLVALTFFFITDPYNLRPLLFGSDSAFSFPDGGGADNGGGTDDSGTGANATGGGFTLSPAQKQALVNVGIDPGAVPNSISAEQESCFVGVLGEARVGEIRNGAVPNAIEFAKAKSCI